MIEYPLTNLTPVTAYCSTWQFSQKTRIETNKIKCM